MNRGKEDDKQRVGSGMCSINTLDEVTNMKPGKHEKGRHKIVNVGDGKNKKGKNMKVEQKPEAYFFV